jgi:hypothetical protein
MPKTANANARKPTQWPEFTCEQALKTLQEHVGVVCMTPMIPEGGVSKYKVDGLTTHVVYLRNNFPREIGTDRFYETFAHELIHVLHYTRGLPTDEKAVERECVRFYAANQVFIRELWKSVTESSQYLVWNPPRGSPATNRDRLKLIKGIIRANRGRG